MATNNPYTLKLDGIDDYISIPNFIKLGDSNLIVTIEFWAKGFGRLISTNRSSNSQGNSYIGMNSSGELFYTYANLSDSPYEERITSTISADTSKMNYYSLIIDGKNNKYTFIINDEQETIIKDLVQYNNTYDDVEIGRFRNYTYGTNYFLGEIDEIRFWNEMKDANELIKNKNKVFEMEKATGLMTYLSLNGSVKDETNKYTPILYGNPEWINGEVELFRNKVLFSSGLKGYSYNGDQLIESGLTEQDFINYGMNKDAVIDMSMMFSKKEIINADGTSTVEDGNFYLEDVLGDNASIIYYTDNPDRTESSITIETEPFSFYREMGNSMDILYYTDNTAAAGADLHITANYNPLDELSDPELLYYTDVTTVTTKTIQETAIPKPKLIIPLQSLTLHGILNKLNLIANETGSGIVRVILSEDNGQTWKTFSSARNTFVPITINAADYYNIKVEGISADVLSTITKNQWDSFFISNNTYKVAFYIEQNYIDDQAVIDLLQSEEEVTTTTPTLNSLSIIYDAIDQKYYGLMFMDTNEQYYSTSIGEVLKYLDMGTLIAGQTSLDVKIKLVNNLNFPVTNINLSTEETMSGVMVELCEDNNPFIAKSMLEYLQTLNTGDFVEFYLRINTDKTAQKGGTFDIKVKGDPA